MIISEARMPCGCYVRFRTAIENFDGVGNVVMTLMQSVINYCREIKLVQRIVTVAFGICD